MTHLKYALLRTSPFVSTEKNDKVCAAVFKIVGPNYDNFCYVDPFPRSKRILAAPYSSVEVNIVVRKFSRVLKRTVPFVPVD